MNTPTKKLDIVVAVDGSAPSDAAVDWAAHEAALRKRPLTIVHVVQLPVVRMWPEVSMPQELIDGLIKEGHGILDAARARAEKVIEAARSAARVTVETEDVPVGGTRHPAGPSVPFSAQADDHRPWSACAMTTIEGRAGFTERF